MATVARRSQQATPISGSRLPPIALPTNCPGCGIGLDPDALREHNYVCDCGHHFRMHADAWIALVADEGTWEERWADIRPHDLLEWKVPKPYQDILEQARETGEAVEDIRGPGPAFQDIGESPLDSFPLGLLQAVLT